MVSRTDVGFLVGFVVIIGGAIHFSLYVKDITPEWPNNVTLVIEVAVGMIVTLVITMIANRHEKTIEDKINKIKEYVSMIKNFDIQKRYDAEKNLLSYMRILGQMFAFYFDCRKNFHTVSDDVSKRVFETMMGAKVSEIQTFVLQNIVDPSIVNTNNFSVHDITEINTILTLVSRSPSNSDNYTDSSKCFTEAQEKNKIWITEMETRVEVTKNLLDK